jgi:hypothetical protein
MANRQSKIANRKSRLAWAADQAARMPMVQDRCHKHPERYAATSIERCPVCWECFFGPDRFAERFGKDAETFYQPGGPGYAGRG